MESVINFTFRRPRHHLRHHQIPLSLHHRRPSISKPISSFSFSTSSSSLKMSSFSLPIKVSISNSPSSIPNPQQKPSISPLKTALITVVTAAAIFLSQLSLKPVLANSAVSAPPPPATVESQSVADADPDTKSGYKPDPKEEEKEESVPKESESDVANPEMEPGKEADPEEEVKEEFVPKESENVVANHEMEPGNGADREEEVKEESVPKETESIAIVANPEMEPGNEADTEEVKEESVPKESESVVADLATEESGYEADHPEEEEVVEEEEEEEESESDVADSETDSDSDSESDTEYVPDPEQLNTLEQRIASDPKDVEALRTLMNIKLVDKKPLEALVFLEKLLILEPNDKELPFLKEYIHTITGNLEASRNTFHEIISKDPFRMEAYHGLIRTAESEEEMIEAEQKVKEGLEKAKKAKKKVSERKLNVLLAHILVLRQEYDDALRIYKDLITEKPSDCMPYMYQGIVYILMKKDVEARKSLREYRRLAPNNHRTRKRYFDSVRDAKLLVKERENEKVSSRR